MKILFLNNYHYLRGGSERVYFGEMNLLRAKGHEVQAFARKTDQDAPARYSEVFPEDLKTDSVSIGVGALRTVKEIIYSSESKKLLRRLLDEFRPDIVHAHNIYGRLTTSVLDLLNGFGIPVAMTLHDYKLICPNYKLMYGNRICEDCQGRFFFRAIRNRCHKQSLAASAIYAFESWFNLFFKKYAANVRFFIAPSRFLKNKLVENGLLEEQVVYVPNYIASQDYVPDFEFENYLLYIGRLSGEKGIATLVQAFKGIPDEDLKLIVVGEGPKRQELENLSSGDGRIVFTGYLSGKELDNITRRARGVVVPSEWYENAPISILEAFAYGKPVIGARIGGIPEMIDDGSNGFLFESGNIQDLEFKLAKLLNKSKYEIGKMGASARQKIESQFSAGTHCQQLMDLYAKMLSN